MSSQNSPSDCTEFSCPHHGLDNRVRARDEKAMPLLVILGGGMVEAHEYRRQNVSRWRRVLEVGSAHSLRGVGGPIEVVRVGTWADRRDLEEIEQNLSVIWATERAST